MIIKEDLKQKLLALDVFICNEYFDKYIDLIVNNYATKQIKDQTQKHHCIPKNYFLHRNLPVDNSSENLINLHIADHIRAHYYLYKCMKNDIEKYSNLYALRRMLGGTFSDQLTIEDMNDIECEQLYKEYNEYNRKSHLGKKHLTSEETKKKISQSNKNKYHDYKAIHDINGVEKRVPLNDLANYLNNGWFLGRSENTLQHLKDGYNYESKGMLGKKLTLFQKEQARNAQLGKKKSLEARENMSKAHTGKHLYINPDTGKGVYLDKNEIEKYLEKGYIKYHRKNK